MINIFIIDDSVLFRTKLTKELDKDDNIKVVGTANDVMIAQKKLKIIKDFPDIIILDIELPQIDGLTFLKESLSKSDMKVIVCTSHYEKYKDKAILYGADAILDKNRLTNDDSSILLETIHTVKNRLQNTKQRINSNNTISMKKATKIVAIGASTGGLEILETIIPLLPNKTPPILIVQHMGRDIIPTFIPKIKEKSKVQIKEAKHKDILEENTIYFAPFNKHLSIKKTQENNYTVIISDQEKVSYHKPSIDVLFNSIATEAASDAVAFILTGMGYDGVQGIKNIKQSGGKTFAQDEDSCKVFGMPKAAMESNMIDKVISPLDIPREILFS